MQNCTAARFCLARQLVVGLLTVLLCSVVSAQPAAPQNGAVDEFVAEYVKAWNAGDKEALNLMWTADSELIDANGVVVDRKALMAARLGQNNGPRPTLSITVTKARLLEPNVALVDGGSTLTMPGGSALQRTRFSGVLVREDGGWRIRLIRQLSASSRQSPPAEPLKEMSWMVGEWAGIGDGLHVHLSTDWDLDGRFIVSRYEYRPEQGEPFDAEVRAGWDPATHSIKSWYFDSRGVTSSTTWRAEGDHWLGAITGTQRDGEKFTGTLAITPIDDDSYLRTLTNITVGDEVLPAQELRVFRVSAEPTK